MMPDEICAYSEFNKLQGQWNSENIPGQGMSSYTRTDLYTALQQENAALVEKIKVLVKAQDENLGTPCENVRLQQENERLRETTVFILSSTGDGQRFPALKSLMALDNLQKI